MDWSSSPLGPIGSWPQSLRTTVGLCLASTFPIALAWGPARVLIYNDGYRPICGGKHPHAMGQDFKECWASAWPVIGAAFERGLRGEPSCIENQRIFIDRHGSLEEAFFTFSFSPIRDETGGVGGLFHPVTEQTGRMLSVRRTRALRDLTARTVSAKTSADVFKLTARTLAEYDLDIPFSLFYVLDAVGMRAELAACSGLIAGTAAAPAVIDADMRAPWPLAELVESGGQSAQAGRIDGLARQLCPLACGPYPNPPDTALMLPILPAGAARPLGVMIVGISSRLVLDDSYRGFVDLLAAAVTAAAVNARAHEGERQRALVGLRDCETRLKVALEAGRLGSWEMNMAQGNTIRSAMHDTIFGYDEPWPHWGMPEFLQHVIPEHRAQVAADFRAGVAQQRHWHVQCQINRADGQLRWIEVFGHPVYDDDGKLTQVFGVVSDITERKQTEAALRQAQKMEAVGTLTGGLAHDFNNLLAIMIGNLDLLPARVLGDQESKELVSEALQQSEPGRGTAVRLFLPRAAAGIHVAPIARSHQIVGGNETILVADDNAGVRRVVAMQLGKLGYAVLEAENGDVALRMLASHRVDLLLSDVVMPGALNGLDLARAATARWPGLGVVLISGFAPAGPDGAATGDGQYRLLTKPYRRADLSHVLREALADRRVGSSLV
jgi:CheY-like chemotaxis protein